MKPGDVKAVAKRVLLREKVDGELAVIFVDDEAMSAWNYQYTKRKGPTDVLAFPMREGKDSEFSGGMIGDIIISIDRAKDQARELGHSFKREILLLVIHGLLHLLGYDHDSMTRLTGELEEELKGVMG